MAKTKTIYQRGADNGLWLGLCFLAIFAAATAAMSVAAVNIVAIALALMVPCLCFRFLRRTYVDGHGMTTFSALWMQGIVGFACGSVIFGTGTYVYMRFADPTFITRVITAGIEYYAQSPVESAREIGLELQKMIDMRLTPRPQDVCLVWMWAIIFSGSLLSMLVAGIVRLRRVPTSVM